MRQIVLSRPKCLVLPCFLLLISHTLAYIMIHSTDINTTDQNRTLCKQKVRLTQQYPDFICAGAIPLTLTANFTTALVGGSHTFWQAVVCYYYMLYHRL